MINPKTAFRLCQDEDGELVTLKCGVDMARFQSVWNRFENARGLRVGRAQRSPEFGAAPGAEGSGFVIGDATWVYLGSFVIFWGDESFQGKSEAFLGAGGCYSYLGMLGTGI